MAEHIEHGQLSSGERAVLAAIQRHFSGQIIPELLPLVEGNDIWREWRAATFAEQRPQQVVFACGKLPPELIFGVTEPGIQFSVLAQGLGGKIAHLASANYAVEHLKDTNGDPSVKVVLVLAHGCSSKASIPCRPQIGTMPIGEEARIAGLKSSPDGWNKGLAWVDIPREPGAVEVPQGDWLHARATLTQIVQYSEPIQKLTREGQQVVVQAWYNDDTGEVVISSVLTSNDPAKAPPKDDLIKVATGRYAGKLDDLHPALRELERMMFGNRIHVSRFRPAVPTGVLFLCCADSRVPPGIITQAPNGLIRVTRNAGLMVNDGVIRSLTIAVEDSLYARKEQGLPEKLTIVVMGHADCGAAKATLASLSGQSIDQEGTNLAGPIISKLQHRFGQYIEQHPDYKETDPRLLEAAVANAVGAAYDLLSDIRPAALRLRAWMREGKLDVVPAVYGLDGMLTFLRPMPVPVDDE